MNGVCGRQRGLAGLSGLTNHQGAARERGGGSEGERGEGEGRGSEGERGREGDVIKLQHAVQKSLYTDTDMAIVCSNA